MPRRLLAAAAHFSVVTPALPAQPGVSKTDAARRPQVVSYIDDMRGSQGSHSEENQGTLTSSQHLQPLPAGWEMSGGTEQWWSRAACSLSTGKMT